MTGMSGNCYFRTYPKGQLIIFVRYLGVQGEGILLGQASHGNLQTYPTRIRYIKQFLDALKASTFEGHPTAGLLWPVW
jgi:hypothetical protein